MIIMIKNNIDNINGCSSIVEVVVVVVVVVVAAAAAAATTTTTTIYLSILYSYQSNFLTIVSISI